MNTTPFPYIVGDLMANEPIVVHADAPVADAVRAMDDFDISGLPVVDPTGEVVGVISQTDLLHARATEWLWANWDGLKVRHLMTRPALTIERSASAANPPSRGWRSTTSIDSWSYPMTTRHGRSGSSRRATSFEHSRVIRDDDWTPLSAHKGTRDAQGAARVRAFASPRRCSTSTPTSRNSAASVVPAYRRGVADAEWPADVGLARSVVPPGTAATRDFSGLAPRLPQFIAERCVGCMACVSACPDSAILGIVVPQSAAGRADLDLRRSASPSPTWRARRRATTSSTHRSTARCRHGAASSRRRSGSSSSPLHCKGCAECVDVCTALGHDALFMTDKTDTDAERRDRARPSARATCASFARCRRRRPSTGTRRRSPT